MEPLGTAYYLRSLRSEQLKFARLLSHFYKEDICLRTLLLLLGDVSDIFAIELRHQDTMTSAARNILNDRVELFCSGLYHVIFHFN